jgi:hypothetical protein
MSVWIRGSASDWLDFSDELVAAATGNSMTGIAIISGGTGYTLGDILTVVGGTGTVVAQLEVSSLAGTVIDGVRIYNAGVYTVNPGNPNAVTGGTGSSASMAVAFAASGWTVKRDTTWSGSETEVILEGSGGGSDEILIGWRTFSDGPGDYYNFELHGMTGYSSGLDIQEQPGISPGVHDGVAAAQFSGAYLVATNVPFYYFLNINAYRIIITIFVGSVYNHAYLGWGNRFATSTEYPYPMVIAGSASRPEIKTSESAKHSTLTDPWTISGSDARGPMLIYGTDGAWYDVTNRLGTSPKDDRCVIPCQRPQGVSGVPSDPEDRFMTTGIDFSDLIFSLSSGDGGAAAANLLPTGDDDHRVLLPAIVVFSVPSAQVLVELDEVFWCHSFGGPKNEDRFINDSDFAFRIFQNCNRTEDYSYLAIKEGSY